MTDVDNPNDGTPTGNPDAGIDDAIVKELQGRVDKLDNRAKSMSFNTTEEYVAFLEEEAFKKIEAEVDDDDDDGAGDVTPTTPPTTPPQTPPTPQTPPANAQPQDNKMFEQMGRIAATAALEAQ